MCNFRSYAGGIAIVIAALIVVPARADTVDNLVTFSAGTTARASEVNGNFSEVADSVNDNDARIAALEAEIASLRAELNNVLNVNQYLSLETVNGQPTIRVTAANLQVVNGLGHTDGANGTGNVLIGYDEVRDLDFQCSIGTDPDTAAPVANETECLAAGGIWADSHKSGSHYLIVGPEHNYSRWGGIVVGLTNTSNNDFASVSGGQYNVASGFGASVSGGQLNVASGQVASVSGGVRNIAGGGRSTVSGGAGNIAGGERSTVSGGVGNIAGGNSGSVSGGRSNVASGTFASVSGGNSNEALGSGSSISAGSNNTASGSFSSITGGGQNQADGPYSTISGGYSNETSGSRSHYSSVSGGAHNVAKEFYSSISGGSDRSVDGESDWAAGGLFQEN